jgi:2-keto-4-pentenoate hydratase/2-oxohepta-3-ene-1,7-dioic acid hydratase in catechol pathway
MASMASASRSCWEMILPEEAYSSASVTVVRAVGSLSLPWIETDLNPANVRVQGRLNGKVMQEANTSLMIFSVAYLISYLSRCMTLLPGTVLLTGTPAGCGFAQKPPVWLKGGDVYEVDIEGIGVLRNPVIEEK